MRFLLERLAATSGINRNLPESFDLEVAVASQIQRIVSARPVATDGDERTLEGYGMPSVVELSRDNSYELECYAARLRRMIVHYEPRLRDPEVTVESMESGASPYRLVVSGVLTPDTDSRTFRFELPHQ